MQRWSFLILSTDRLKCEVLLSGEKTSDQRKYATPLYSSISDNLKLQKESTNCHDEAEEDEAKVEALLSCPGSLFA